VKSVILDEVGARTRHGKNGEWLDDTILVQGRHPNSLRAQDLKSSRA